MHRAQLVQLAALSMALVLGCSGRSSGEGDGTGDSSEPQTDSSSSSTDGDTGDTGAGLVDMGAGDGEGVFDGECEEGCTQGWASCSGTTLSVCTQVSDTFCNWVSTDCAPKVCDQTNGVCEWECVLNNDCP